MHCIQSTCVCKPPPNYISNAMQRLQQVNATYTWHLGAQFSQNDTAESSYDSSMCGLGFGWFTAVSPRTGLKVSCNLNRSRGSCLPNLTDRDARMASHGEEVPLTHPLKSSEIMNHVCDVNSSRCCENKPSAWIIHHASFRGLQRFPPTALRWSMMYY